MGERGARDSEEEEEEERERKRRRKRRLEEGGYSGRGTRPVL